jgi:hypothetical protein
MKCFFYFFTFCSSVLFSCQRSDQKSETLDSLNVTIDTIAVPETNSNDGPEPIVPRVEMKGTSVWQGTISNKTEMTLTLTFSKDVVYGNVVYKKSGKPILLIGYRDDQNNFSVNEYYGSKEVTGIYSGAIRSKDSISGYWYGGNYEEGQKFTISRKETTSDTAPEFKEDFTGNYAFHYAGENGAFGSMAVGLKGDSVTYSFDCATSGPGFNLASIMATSKLENNYAKYSEKNEYGLCEFEIFFVPGVDLVRHADGGWECGFGHNASVSGCYFKENNIQPDFDKISKELFGR